MAWISNGTVAVTVGSRIVTGTGTSFGAGGALPGDGLVIDGKVFEIEVVNSDTQITLVADYSDATASDLAYSIIPTQSRNLETQQVLSQYLAAGGGKFGDGSVAAPGIAFVNKPGSGLRVEDNGDLVIVRGQQDKVIIGADALSGDLINFFHPGNLLGTVSETGGVPTGAVIESGSSGSGDYVRYADGTQICTWTRSLFTSGAAGWNFPASFVTAPRVFGVRANASTINAAFCIETEPTTSNVTVSMRRPDDSRIGGSVNLQAFGRWF